MPAPGSPIPDPTALDGLSSDQLVAALAVPLPPAPHSTRVTWLLWVVRIVLLVLTGLVIYAFIAAL